MNQLQTETDQNERFTPLSKDKVAVNSTKISNAIPQYDLQQTSSRKKFYKGKRKKAKQVRYVSQQRLTQESHGNIIYGEDDKQFLTQTKNSMGEGSPSQIVIDIADGKLKLDEQDLTPKTISMLEAQLRLFKNKQANKKS